MVSCILLAFLTALELLSTTVIAQNSEVACLAQSSWEFNDRTQSPCLVWARLTDICRPNAFSVAPLGNTSVSYASPGTTDSYQADGCTCNVVAYNLMAACTYCQGNDTVWVNEMEWRQGCTSYNSSQPFDIGVSGLHIPSWAYIPDNGSYWNPELAHAVALQSGAATATLAASMAGSSPTSTSTPGWIPVPVEGTQQSGDNTTIAPGLIAAAVIGGIAVFLLLGINIYVITRLQRGQNKAARSEPRRVDLETESSRPGSVCKVDEWEEETQYGSKFG